MFPALLNIGNQNPLKCELKGKKAIFHAISIYWYICLTQKQNLKFREAKIYQLITNKLIAFMLRF